ncbi:hypothetical protein TeGR_g10344, partial [Tetraparma gracilis]
MYTLVYKTLEVLTDKKKNEEKKDSGSGDADIDPALTFDVELNFLLLDDLIAPGGAAIDLKPEDVDALPSFSHDSVEFGRSAKRRTSHQSNRRLSNASAISRGSAALSASLAADVGSSGLRLMSADVDASGALLLPGSNVLRGEESDDDNFGDFGDDDDLRGFDMDEKDDLLGDKNSSLINASTASGVSDSLAFIDPAAAADSSSSSRRAAPGDPWALLDPMAKAASKGKPLKAGRTYTLPPGLPEAGAPPPAPADLDESAESASASINRSSFVVEDEDLKLKGLAYGKE